MSQTPIQKWEGHAKLLGERIHTARKEAGLSGQELAERVGITRSYLHKLERGDIASPSVYIIWEIALAVGVSLAHLMGVVESQPLSEVEVSELTRLRRKLALIREIID